MSKTTWDDYLSKFDKPAPQAPEEPAVPGKAPLKNVGDQTSSTVDNFDISELRSVSWATADGVREFYTVGQLAKAVGREPVTVRSWEHKGWLPAPRFRTPPPRGEQLPGKAMKGRRLYTKEQVLYLVAAVKQCGLDHPQTADWGRFHLLMESYPQD